MTEMNKSLTGAPTAKETNWDSINWNQAKSEVKRLQMRIAKAMREKRYGKVRALQRLLSHSFYGKSVAVKRVTQNKGSKCPGIDGIVWRTKRQKMQAILSIKRLGYKSQPLRRIYIPKKNGRRPLSIPTMKDRAMQALHLLGLEPVAESIADKNSYGFRPKRSAADAIAQCYNSLCRKNSAKWIFEGDIESFFDRVDFSWLEKNILMDKVILKRFLRAGYVEKTSIEATTQGVPQGGLISPVIALITLSGLEEQLAQKFKRNRGKVNMIIYADDFVITGESKELLEKSLVNHQLMVQPFVQAVVDEGEYSLFYFAGVLSHSILKTPKSGDFRVQEEHGGQLNSITPCNELLAAAKKALQTIPEKLLYARIDLVKHENKFKVMEIELIEPSLYFNYDDKAANNFAKALDQWMS